MNENSKNQASSLYRKVVIFIQKAMAKNFYYSFNQIYFFKKRSDSGVINNVK